MKCSSFIRISGVWILAAGFSHAFLDTNNNGLSDFWERDFNNGNVFDESFDPQADSDADGWTNAQEAAAGTNPFDPNPPDGLIQPTTAHVPAVLGEENGVPVVITPEVITVSWPTLAGKQYTLLFSPDLTQESWLSVGAPFIAYGGEVTYYFEISQSDKCFWRVSVEDIDEDSDGLTHYEELVAGTNPTITDTDGDTLPDHAELIAGTDPMQADADGDGWTDPQELAAGTDSRNQDTDGDGIPDSIDSNPLVSALSFPDADGDGIPDAEDSAPNNSRGPAPSITSETTSGNPLSNLIKDETMKFVVNVSNPGGPAPTASNLTFFLNGTEKTATITAIGDPASSSQRFLLTWTAETTANYPALTLQNLTLRFRDALNATTWHKLARIDVAEWEGMMASLRTGTGTTIPLLNIVSHSNGVKSRSFYYMSTGQSQAGWYRGSREITFVDGSSGSPLLTAQIAVGMRYPLFIISDSSQGPPTLTETISISSPLEYTHHGELLLNNSANGVRSIYDPGGTNTSLSGQRSYLALPERGNGGTGNTNIRKEIFRDGEWQLSTASTLPLYHAEGTTRRIWSTHYYSAANPSGLDYKGTSLIAPVEAKIIPHAAGTLDYPGLPLPIDRNTDSKIHSTHPALLPIGQGAWHKIVLKAGPDAAALSNGIGIWLRKGESGADDPQTGFTMKVLGDNETLADLAVPADGKITLAADSANWLRLTSPQGLTLFLSKDETVTDIHDLSLQLLKKREWHPQDSVKIVDVDILPVEVAPEVLAVNSDFDEGRIDSTTGYAIPDCDDTDIALEAVRNHLDGKFAINDRVTDDMHAGFFGVNPSNLGNDFWAGANVTIRKIDKTDPATGHPESGHIRLFGKWGNGPSEYRAIVPYDFDTLATTNLVTAGINRVPGESVYGSSSPFPAGTSYFIEGVHPGKITLEWRYQKGSIDLKHEQSFEVCTHKNATQWKHDLAYKIRLETSNDPSGEIQTIAVMLPGESYKERMERATEYYDFYQDCFLTPLRSKPLHPQSMTWPGLARLAGSQVVGGLSDSEYARMLLEVGSIPGYVLPQQIQDDFMAWSLSETKDLQQALFTGARTIFQSIGWQMHAYRSSGYRALDWVETETNETEVSALSGVWKNLRMGILNHDKTTLDQVALDITRREQNVTIVPTWGVISGLFLGTTNWMFSILGENSCTPSGLNFRDLFPQIPVPTGSLANTADRWTWIQPATADGILDTWNKHPIATRDGLVRATLEQDARRFSRVHQLAYQFPTYLYLPIWVWDNEDVP